MKLMSCCVNSPVYIWTFPIDYHQVPNIRCTLVGNKIVNHSDVVGASPVGAVSNYIFILDLTTGFIGLDKDNCTTRRETSKFGDLVRLILEILWYFIVPIPQTIQDSLLIHQLLITCISDQQQFAKYTLLLIFIHEALISNQINDMYMGQVTRMWLS